MVPSLTRRRLLAAGGTLAGGLSGGRALAAVRSSAGDRPSDRESAGAWPMAQRDPAGRSYAPSATPPKDGASVRWKRRIDTDLNFGYGPTPAVANGRVYAVGRELLVLDAATGAVQFRLDRAARAAPAVARASAYRSPTLAVSSSRGVTGYHANGALDLPGIRIGPTRWDGDAAGRETHSFGFDANPATPVAADGTVVVSTGGALTAIDASSGAVRWRADGSQRRPAVRRGTVYAADYVRGLSGYDLASGERQFEAEVSGSRPVSVTAGTDLLVVATDDGLAGVSYDGTTRWQFSPADLARDRGGVALAEGVAYAGFRGEEDDYLVAVDASDGSERWRSPAAPESTPQFAPPSVADGVVYVPTEDGGLAAVDAEDGRVRWRFGDGEPERQPGPWSPAALAGETLYAVGDGHVYALEEA